jgi:hypothetical protein
MPALSACALVSALICALLAAASPSHMHGNWKGGGVDSCCNNACHGRMREPHGKWPLADGAHIWCVDDIQCLHLPWTRSSQGADIEPRLCNWLDPGFSARATHRSLRLSVTVQIWLYAYAPKCRTTRSTKDTKATTSTNLTPPCTADSVAVNIIRAGLAHLHKPTTRHLHGLACQTALAQFQHARAPNTAVVSTAPSCTHSVAAKYCRRDTPWPQW